MFSVEQKERSSKEARKTYCTPEIMQVTITSRANLMQGSYHQTLGLQDSEMDDALAQFLLGPFWSRFFLKEQQPDLGA